MEKVELAAGTVDWCTNGQASFVDMVSYTISVATVASIDPVYFMENIVKDRLYPADYEVGDYVKEYPWKKKS